MSDRLRHLQRQQAILREHLAWIDSEIARELPVVAAFPPALVSNPSGTAVVGANPPAAPFAPHATPATASRHSSPAPPALPAADPDALLERYASTERQTPADIRRGCFIVFFTAFLLLSAAVVTVWILFYR